MCRLLAGERDWMASSEQVCVRARALCVRACDWIPSFAWGRRLHAFWYVGWRGSCEKNEGKEADWRAATVRFEDPISFRRFWSALPRSFLEACGRVQRISQLLCPPYILPALREGVRHEMSDPNVTEGVAFVMIAA